MKVIEEINKLAENQRRERLEMEGNIGGRDIHAVFVMFEKEKDVL